MRTTVDIRADVFERARQLARAENRDLSDLVNDALVDLLGRAPAGREGGPRYRVVPLPGDGLQAGVDLTSNASVQQALDDEARDPVTGQYDLDQLR